MAPLLFYLPYWSSTMWQLMRIVISPCPSFTGKLDGFVWSKDLHCIFRKLEYNINFLVNHSLQALTTLSLSGAQAGQTMLHISWISCCLPKLFASIEIFP